MMKKIFLAATLSLAVTAAPAVAQNENPFAGTECELAETILSINVRSIKRLQSDIEGYDEQDLLDDNEKKMHENMLARNIIEYARNWVSYRQQCPDAEPPADLDPKSHPDIFGTLER